MATIDKRTDSKGAVKYRVRWREGGRRDGQWQSATFTRLKGERGAEKFKAKVDAAGQQWPEDKTGATSIPGTVTIAQLADAWLEDRKKRVRSDRTPADYRRDLDNWVIPTFGDRQADTITETDVQTWVDGMSDGTVARADGKMRKAAAKSVHDRHAILSGMYRYALAPSRAWVDRNPCDLTDLPKRQKKPPKALTPGEWSALYPALRQIDGHAADLALFMLATGWRWSEATALTTFDVEDYGPGRPCYVLMGHVVRRNAAGQHVVVEEGKGEASLRRTRLDEEAAELVRRRVYPLTPGTLVFRTGISPQNGLGGSQWHYSNFMDRVWNPAVKAANLTRRPTPHWLRHTAVVWMHDAGAKLPELQRRIGHASIGTTMGVYGRAIEDVPADVLTRFAAMRQGVLSGPGEVLTITEG